METFIIIFCILLGLFILLLLVAGCYWLYMNIVMLFDPNCRKLKEGRISKIVSVRTPFKGLSEEQILERILEKGTDIKVTIRLQNGQTLRGGLNHLDLKRGDNLRYTLKRNFNGGPEKYTNEIYLWRVEQLPSINIKTKIMKEALKDILHGAFIGLALLAVLFALLLYLTW